MRISVSCSRAGFVAFPANRSSCYAARSTNPTVATLAIDIGKNSFHVVGVD